MDARAALVLSLLCAWGGQLRAEENATDTYRPPRFCRTYECPRYQVIRKYDLYNKTRENTIAKIICIYMMTRTRGSEEPAAITFEIRTYEASKWVTTPLELDFLGIGMFRSFRRLFNYINGQNSAGIKMKMTVPVRIHVPLLNPSDRNATMSFFISSAVTNPPQPLNQDVYLEYFPPQSVYVKSFGGYALKPEYHKKSKFLSEELRALGFSFDSTYGTAASYNDPLTIFDRHNEVWYIAT